LAIFCPGADSRIPWGTDSTESRISRGSIPRGSIPRALGCDGRLRGNGRARGRAGLGFVVSDGHGLGVEGNGAVSEGVPCGSGRSVQVAGGGARRHTVRGRPVDGTSEPGFARGGPRLPAPRLCCCQERGTDVI
jgi:hypothetical protein